MFHLNTTRSYPQWRATRVTDWMGRTRWAAMNDQNGLHRYPDCLGKDQARQLARTLSAEERVSYKRHLAGGFDV